MIRVPSFSIIMYSIITKYPGKPNAILLSLPSILLLKANLSLNHFTGVRGQIDLVNNKYQTLKGLVPRLGLIASTREIHVGRK